MGRDTIFALTSLSPADSAVPRQREAIRSWQAAGLSVRCFNHPFEVARMRGIYDVDFVPVSKTSSRVFGQPYVPINAMLRWARIEDVSALLVNSDIEIELSLAQLQRVRRASEGGLCYFIRHNYDERKENAAADPWGIDAFLLHGRDAFLVPDSFLSMGQPWWDYWLPLIFVRQGRPLYSVEFPAIFHRNHTQRWSWRNWHRCALEFDRFVGWLGTDRSSQACQSMARWAYAELMKHRSAIREMEIEQDE